MILFFSFTLNRSRKSVHVDHVSSTMIINLEMPSKKMWNVRGKWVTWSLFGFQNKLKSILQDEGKWKLKAKMLNKSDMPKSASFVWYFTFYMQTFMYTKQNSIFVPLSVDYCDLKSWICSLYTQRRVWSRKDWEHQEGNCVLGLGRCHRKEGRFQKGKYKSAQAR